MPRTAFYAWQSDTDTLVNHQFIAQALKNAISGLNTDLEIHESEAEMIVDRDTYGEPGMPAIADTVLRKIADASVFVGDLTFVAKIEVNGRPKYLPNANVSIELGYAARAIGFERIVCVFNEHFGDPRDLPFDLVHRRFPVRFRLSPEASAAERSVALASLSDELQAQLHTIIDKLGLAPKTDPIVHAAVPPENCSFIEGGNGEIARAKAQDEEGRASDRVYWHHGPSAWLRLIPAVNKNLTRADLRKLVERATPPLRPFGDSPRICVESNKYGVVAIGYDDHLAATAMQVTQVFQSGEVWGLNRTLIEPKRTQPIRTFQIPWPELEMQLRETLANYINFARNELKTPLPITVVAGLAMVNEARLIREKGKWFANPEKPARCFEDFIAIRAVISKWDCTQPQLFDPFFTKIFDACGQDYRELQTQVWPNKYSG